MMARRDYLVNVWAFQDGRSRNYYERSSFSCWQVEILLSTVLMFIISRFSRWQVEILLWTVEVSMATGRGFYDGTSRLYGEWLTFSRWQVKNLLWTVEIFTSRILCCQVKILDFHDDRLIQISMIKVLISKFRSAGGA